MSLLTATWLPNPGNVAAQSFDGMVRLTWTHAEPNDLVKHYAVYRSASSFSGVSGLTPVLTTRGMRADVTGLANGTPYYFAVTTVNLIDGENPSVQTVTTTPNPVPGSFADLLLTNVVSPASVYRGQTITMNWLVRNVGAGATSTHPRLSRHALSKQRLDEPGGGDRAGERDAHLTPTLSPRRGRRGSRSAFSLAPWRGEGRGEG